MSHESFNEEALRHIGRAWALMTEALTLLDRVEAHQAAALLDNAIGVLPRVEAIATQQGQTQIGSS